MTYSISDLEQLSGIQSHTIRIWEQRYNALKPMRSDGNTRLYDDNQLVRLLNIVSLNQAGLKISKICKLSDQAVNELIDQHYGSSSESEQNEFYISQLIKYGIAFNEFSFSTLMDEAILKLGMINSYRLIIYPLLVRLGFMWRKDDICPAHEHFLSNIIRQKFFAAINSIPLQVDAEKTWLLFLPEDEDHDIGLLFANYMLRINKQKVIFLGSKVPTDSIAKILKNVAIDHALLFMTKLRLKNAAQNYIDQLSEICSSTQIHLAGNSQVIDKLENIDHINWFKSLDEFENSIQKSQSL
ncbi:MerR family transcriptional regulator [Pedobacter frigidisoli]|uniref:MerR family transcriptional regulator n=1 Tax=Pedobacter frigidisoli TaxID=2530455 RepID=A0A4R0P413_9SPHI|nr:MerR family transcriptional regulator [Pedobacter frigidisoli]TCD10442.1 MerR family transcriptional regulator [Pedobacter frigidisoli]